MQTVATMIQTKQNLMSQKQPQFPHGLCLN